MSHALPWHSVAFVIVTALLAILLIGPRLPFVLRLCLTLAAGAAYLVHYVGLESLTGWPSRAPLAGEFDVLGTRVVEPDRTSGRQGHVELWIRRDGAEESRLFRLPYTEPLHDEAARARAGLDDGRAQRGRASASSAGGTGEGSVRIGDKPPPSLPTKSASPVR